VQFGFQRHTADSIMLSAAARRGGTARFRP
jgi:hypothetical protein